MDELARRVAALSTLSPRELEVMRLTCDGMVNKEIADALVITARTVLFHKGNIYDKLGLAEIQPAPREREIGKFCQALAAGLGDTPVAPSGAEPEPSQPSMRALAAAAEDSKALDKVRLEREEQERARQSAVVPVPAAVPQAWTAPPIPPVIPSSTRAARWPIVVLGAVVLILGAALGAVVLTRDNDARIVERVITVTPETPAGGQRSNLPAATSAPVAATIVATSPPAATPSPTPVPSGTVLYEANAATGWTGWPSAPGWKIAGGTFVSDGRTGSTGSRADAPYVPGDHGIDDYAVEAEVRVDAMDGVLFGVFARGNYRGIFGNSSARIETITGSGISEPREYSFPRDADGSWHTYRLEVRGNTLTLMKDGGVILRATDNRFLTGGSVGLYSHRVQLTVRAFRVIKL